MIIRSHLRTLLAPEKAQYQNSGRRWVSLSHLIIKWLWVICERYIQTQWLVCRATDPTADDQVVLRARLTLYRAAFATAKINIMMRRWWVGPKLARREMKKGSSFSLSLVCLGSLLWVKSETGEGTQSCVFFLINTGERSKAMDGGWNGWNILPWKGDGIWLGQTASVLNKKYRFKKFGYLFGTLNTIKLCCKKSYWCYLRHLCIINNSIHVHT
jgi:hypothetical protein